MTHAADVSTTSGARTIDHRGSGPLPPGARIPRGLLVHRGDHAETVTAASSGNELTGVQWISFDTATHQQSGVEVAADISWSMFLENFITGPSRLLALTTEPPQAPQASEDWRSGLARLRSWRGDRTVGEARRLPPTLSQGKGRRFTYRADSSQPWDGAGNACSSVVRWRPSLRVDGAGKSRRTLRNWNLPK